MGDLFRERSTSSQSGSTIVVHKVYEQAQRDAPAVLPLGSKNDLARCPAPAIACPTDPISPEAVSSSTEWEWYDSFLSSARQHF